MPAVTIREATAADDVAIGELLVNAFVEQYAVKLPQVQVTDRRKRELRAVPAKRAVARVYVAELDGQLVGTVALWPPGAEGSEAWLPDSADVRHLAVAKRGRGKGVSAALLDAVEAVARTVGAKRLTLHVRREATGVRALYERRGYVRAPHGDRDALPEVFLEALVLELP
jgi:GNAT superfamily N-acetyltransferase